MKSDKYTELSRRSLVWLEGRSTQRGIRGCEEVIISEGYVADAAAICGLQSGHCKLFTGEYFKANDDYVFVFETKVSRGDFFNTFKHGNHGGDRMQPVGNFHFVVTTKALVKSEEVPDPWGLLEQSGQGCELSKCQPLSQ